MIALGIAVAGAGCGVMAVETVGVTRIAWGWTSAACAIATAAYVLNRPEWLGKQDGRLTARALVVLPYHVAIRIACALMRRVRAPDAPTLVGRGLWVGGKVERRSFPAGVTHVVDLVAEYAAPAWLRSLPGYRALPVLDGAQPPDPAAFLALVRELRDVTGDVLVHCDSGRGRAPTLAAAILLARNAAPDVDAALALVRARRPVASPTRADVAFLQAVWPSLRELRGRDSVPRRGGDGIGEAVRRPQAG